jgi:hypothetical protein
MKIIHIAPENYAGIPYRLMRAERNLGHDSRLITLMRHPRGLPEDICLELPLITSPLTKSLKKLFSGGARDIINRRAKTIPVWKTGNTAEKLFIKFRDRVWLPKVKKIWEEVGGAKADLIILDGGHGLLKYDSIISSVKAEKYAFYYGSDLRFRGLMPGIDEICEKKFTFEYDLSLLDSKMNFLFFPFDFTETDNVKRQNENDSKKIVVGHAPTNRVAKGTDKILAALDKLKNEFSLEVELIENLPYKEALKKKSRCDLFIDQIGELGYGVNSVESLAMGIPTAVELLDDFDKFLSPHPFYNIRSSSLLEDLIKVFKDRNNWQKKSEMGQRWVREKHDVNKIIGYYL